MQQPLSIVASFLLHAIFAMILVLTMYLGPRIDPNLVIVGELDLSGLVSGDPAGAPQPSGGGGQPKPKPIEPVVQPKPIEPIEPVVQPKPIEPIEPVVQPKPKPIEPVVQPKPKPVEPVVQPKPVPKPTPKPTPAPPPKPAPTPKPKPDYVASAMNELRAGNGSNTGSGTPANAAVNDAMSELATGTAASGTGGGSGGSGGGLEGLYGKQIFAAVQPYWSFPEQSGTNMLSVAIYVTISPSGEVLQARVSKPSGNPRFDASALAAIDAAGILPKPPPGLTSLDINFSPDKL